MDWHKDEFTITTDASRADVAYIHSFISTTYWAADIPMEVIQKSINGSMCFLVFKHDQQIGFARVVTDKATFGYLADVFIDEKFRGLGLSKWLMEVIMGHPDLQGFRRWMLGTRDAHGLYRKFGFTELTYIDRWMQIHNPDVYKKKSDV